MTDLHSIFTEFVKHTIWPELKQRGYKKTGNNFRLYNSSGWGKIVQLQLSQWNSGQHLRFTVNAGLYLPEVAHYLLKRDPGIGFSESVCIVRERIGQLKPAKKDEWYNLQMGSDPAPVLKQALEDVKRYALPFLATINSREDIFFILETGYRSAYIPAQIQAMHHAGYQEAAAGLLATEFSKAAWNKHYQVSLMKLAQELGIRTAA